MIPTNTQEENDTLYEWLVTLCRDISGHSRDKLDSEDGDRTIGSFGFIVESQTVQNNLSMHELVSSRCYNCADRRQDEVEGGEFARPSGTYLDNSNIFSLARALSLALSLSHTHTWFHIPPQRHCGIKQFRSRVSIGHQKETNNVYTDPQTLRIRTQKIKNERIQTCMSPLINLGDVGLQDGEVGEQLRAQQSQSV